MSDDRRHFLVTGATAAAGLLLRAAVRERRRRRTPRPTGRSGAAPWPPARRPGPGRSLEWSEGRNVRYKVELPGDGKSTPILWRDLVILTAALPAEKKLAPRAHADPGRGAAGPRRNPDVQEVAASPWSSWCWPFRARTARCAGGAACAWSTRTRAPTRTAASPGARPSPTASASTPSSARAGSTPSTSRAACSGRRTWAS